MNCHKDFYSENISLREGDHQPPLKIFSSSWLQFGTNSRNGYTGGIVTPFPAPPATKA
jgi:hypothetical protein